MAAKDTRYQGDFMELEYLWLTPFLFIQKQKFIEMGDTIFRNINKERIEKLVEYIFDGNS